MHILVHISPPFLSPFKENSPWYYREWNSPLCPTFPAPLLALQSRKEWRLFSSLFSPSVTSGSFYIQRRGKDAYPGAYFTPLSVQCIFTICCQWLNLNTKERDRCISWCVFHPSFPPHSKKTYCGTVENEMHNTQSNSSSLPYLSQACSITCPAFPAPLSPLTHPGWSLFSNVFSASVARGSGWIQSPGMGIPGLPWGRHWRSLNVLEHADVDIKLPWVLYLLGDLKIPARIGQAQVGLRWGQPVLIYPSHFVDAYVIICRAQWMVEEMHHLPTSHHNWWT